MKNLQLLYEGQPMTKPEEYLKVVPTPEPTIWKTLLGFLDLQMGLLTKSTLYNAGSDISLKEGWIILDGKRVIQLPATYAMAETDTDVTDGGYHKIYQNLVVLGYQTHVVRLGFNT